MVKGHTREYYFIKNRTGKSLFTMYKNCACSFAHGFRVELFGELSTVCSGGYYEMRKTIIKLFLQYSSSRLMDQIWIFE